MIKQKTENKIRDKRFVFSTNCSFLTKLYSTLHYRLVKFIIWGSHTFTLSETFVDLNYTFQPKKKTKKTLALSIYPLTSPFSFFHFQSFILFYFIFKKQLSLFFPNFVHFLKNLLSDTEVHVFSPLDSFIPNWLSSLENLFFLKKHYLMYFLLNNFKKNQVSKLLSLSSTLMKVGYYWCQELCNSTDWHFLVCSWHFEFKSSLTYCNYRIIKKKKEKEKGKGLLTF